MQIEMLLVENKQLVKELENFKKQPMKVNNSAVLKNNSSINVAKVTSKVEDAVEYRIIDNNDFS
jgi:hypothetical protein